MSAPRIAIPVPHSTDAAYNARSLPQYLHAIEAAGGIPVEVPLSASPAEVARLAASCQGVLLPGSGADVDPEKYGHPRIPACNATDPAREAVDELLMQDAANLDKPLLAICFGFQSWNVWRGGTLIQDIPTQHPTSVNHAPGRTIVDAHSVTIEPGTRLAAIVGHDTPADPLPVNSSHHQAVDQPGDRLRIAARSREDGIIEALEGTSEAFVLAVQWHPERSYDADPASRALFAAFLAAASTWKPRSVVESVAVSGTAADAAR
ncbi:gamma-glutamyl-gamma-aminobutyrate hydrolase family protein [Silvibacterium dinghuense]|uniref:Gamma-glutamyl-gamma-aminobutyrate hydrolase family protein n=1 Tax=Silvibacterium dinghuense TaxID=1560006 RepID=A0A4Q1SK62_9BACT|nr:gamma-glutamyl-gamma-aminobutyrate hydrolase family protein [Silvibacterium dinghuense]RXS97843.1 gamma-glutamyl-gamma-aminobutyrate hydrolase family protein [Silvibacterium dinghuense]GGH02384.1 gamma-glutamyl-gamma-aminobutyrate hydrolase [Silvibacterium dinghuense]